MTIFDELAAVARERHFGHETVHATERPLCRISRIPPDWCLGCRRGWHKPTQLPLPGAEPDELDMPEHRPQCPPESACALCYPAPPLSAIVVEVSSRVFGVPPERIDASALDTEIAGVQERPAALHCACGAPLWFSSERQSGRCFNCMPRTAP